MNNIRQKLQQSALAVPEILLPGKVDLQKWAVIACDQFTQDREYWDKAASFTAGAPTTLNLIFPEVFLTGADNTPRIAAIHKAMKTYLEQGVFGAPEKGFVYIERDTPYQKGRRGLVAAIDLEQYDWKPDTQPLIRSTEGTVAERLPPRMDIRRGAALEVPHVLLLIDDETGSMLPALGERAKKNAPLYQTNLMMDSGCISGWAFDAEEDLAFLAEKLEELRLRSLNRYAADKNAAGGNAENSDAPFLFAVGDGNHSLAAAKGIWEEYKKSRSITGLPEHPCRYAMVEIENLYDPAIQFEPIHRVVFGLGFDKTLSLLSRLPDFSSRPVSGRDELVRLCSEPFNGNRFGLVSAGRYALIETSAAGISTACLQPLLDGALADAGGSSISIDYIHGEEELFRLAENAGRAAAGILLPPVNKAGLFETVARSGPLPRKSFSMGNAAEKRFYLECRRLF
ncbi:MAG: DUF1015 domain-containing protein [Treponema sp.]|nr:DUF1015 domain-containing protein [Treponema sp.]